MPNKKNQDPANFKVSIVEKSAQDGTVPKIAPMVGLPVERTASGGTRRRGQSYGPPADAPVSIASLFKAKGIRSVAPRKGFVAAFEGCEIITPGAGLASTTGPQIIYGAPINPLTMAGDTRLAALSALFDRFDFSKFELSWVPSCPTSTFGDIILGFDHDVDDFFLDYLSSLSALMEEEFVEMGSVFNPLKTLFKKGPGDDSFFVQPSDEEERMTAPGRFWAYFAGTGTVVPTGYLRIDYRVDFADPIPGHGLTNYAGGSVGTGGQDSNSQLDTVVFTLGTAGSLVLGNLTGAPMGASNDGVIYEVLLLPDTDYGSVLKFQYGTDAAAGYYTYGAGDVIYLRGSYQSNTGSYLCFAGPTQAIANNPPICLHATANTTVTINCLARRLGYETLGT